MTIVFIGGGNMASAIIGGLINRGHPAADILVVDPNPAARTNCEQTHGVRTTPALDQTLAAGSACVLAVKPQVMQAVCKSIAPLVGKALIISIAAGSRIAELSKWLDGHDHLVRVMPNTPALVGLGAAGMVASAAVSAADRETALAIMSAVGIAIWLDQESDIDTVTAVTGSGPAYVFRWMEALQQSAESLGLPADKANTLVLQLVRGAAELASQSDLPLSKLREQVTSPGGTTAAGLQAMNENGIAAVIDAGVKAAHQRSIELGKSD